MKKFLFLLLMELCFLPQSGDGSFLSNLNREKNNKLQKCVLSNGVDVILHENFSTPMVMVGIIFHTGTFDVPLDKQGISEIIEENFISKESHVKLMELGISYEVNILGTHTEILAKMNPKHIKKFFQIIMENSFSVENLDLLKKHLIANHKLAHSCREDVVSNLILENIRYAKSNISGTFNEKSLLSISGDDIKNFFEEHYKKCHLSLIINGAIGYKNLIKVLQSTICTLPYPRQQATFGDNYITQTFKSISFKSKYVGRSIRYLYKVSKDDLNRAYSFWEILNYEIFNFFQKSNSMIEKFSSNYVVLNGDCIREIEFHLKSDISLEEFQRSYDVFINRICNQEILQISKSKLFHDYTKEFLCANLDVVYSQIKYDFLHEVKEENELSDPKQFMFFCKRILKDNFILKVIAEYKANK